MSTGLECLLHALDLSRREYIGSPTNPRVSRRLEELRESYDSDLGRIRGTRGTRLSRMRGWQIVVCRRDYEHKHKRRSAARPSRALLKVLLQALLNVSWIRWHDTPSDPEYTAARPSPRAAIVRTSLRLAPVLPNQAGASCGG
jgi:hypothetical protein